MKVGSVMIFVGFTAIVSPTKIGQFWPIARIYMSVRSAHSKLVNRSVVDHKTLLEFR